MFESKFLKESSPFTIKELAKRYAYFLLGYYVDVAVYEKFEPELYSIVEHLENGTWTQKEFDISLVEILRKMRNADMHMGWCDTEFDHRHLERYNNALPQFKDAARERLVKYCYFEPEIACSYSAEIMLRSAMYLKMHDLSKGETTVDRRVQATVVYRLRLLSQGQEAADLSPVLGFDNFLQKRYANIQGNPEKIN